MVTVDDHLASVVSLDGGAFVLRNSVVLGYTVLEDVLPCLNKAGKGINLNTYFQVWVLVVHGREF